MKLSHLDAMINGWFIGGFSPTLHQTEDFEVAVKYYKAGDKEARHLHKIATEFTVILSGSVRMNGVVYTPKDIVVIQPNESTDFEAIEDSITTVVKVPSVKGDKYHVES